MIVKCTTRTSLSVSEHSAPSLCRCFSEKQDMMVQGTTWHPLLSAPHKPVSSSKLEQLCFLLESHHLLGFTLLIYIVLVFFKIIAIPAFITHFCKTDHFWSFLKHTHTHTQEHPFHYIFALYAKSIFFLWCAALCHVMWLAWVRLQGRWRLCRFHSFMLSLTDDNI